MKITRQRMFRSHLILAILVCLLLSLAVSANTSAPWLRAGSIGGDGVDGGSAVKIGADGSRYVAGYFTSTLQFGIGNTPLMSYGGGDIFLTKRDSSGTVLWTIQAGGSYGDDFATDLALDGSENIYLTGAFYNSATFGSTDGNELPVSSSGQTIFLAKYSSSGVVAWVRTGAMGSGGEGRCEGDGVAVGPTTGTVYLAGLCQTDAEFSSADGTYHTVPGVWSWHMVLVKYDRDGDFQWGETSAANPNSQGISVAVDARDSAYVVGWFENETTFYSQNGKNITVKGFSPGQSDSNYPNDTFVVKYGPSGNANWVNHIGGYFAWGMAVAARPDGEVSLVGCIGNIGYRTRRERITTVTSQAPGLYKNLGSGYLTNPYNQDIVIATWDSAGVLRRALRVGGKNNERATGIAYDATGRLSLTGSFEGTFSTGGYQLQANGTNNLFVLQYSGNTLRRAATAINAAFQPVLAWEPKMSADAAGNVFVTGTYQGTAYFGKIRLRNATGFDIFLAKLGLK